MAKPALWKTLLLVTLALGVIFDASETRATLLPLSNSCHIVDGMFDTCPSQAAEWLDVTPLDWFVNGWPTKVYSVQAARTDGSPGTSLFLMYYLPNRPPIIGDGSFDVFFDFQQGKRLKRYQVRCHESSFEVFVNGAQANPEGLKCAVGAGSKATFFDVFVELEVPMNTFPSQDTPLFWTTQGPPPCNDPNGCNCMSGQGQICSPAGAANVTTSAIIIDAKSDGSTAEVAILQPGGNLCDDIGHLVDDLVPPTGSYTNHSDYVSQVTHTTHVILQSLVRSGAITQTAGIQGCVVSRRSPWHHVGKKNPWGVRVGAIRWDAWYGHGKTPTNCVEQALSPIEYWNRLPFFTSVQVSTKAVTIDGDHQAVMDREIDYAAGMGIDYWAFMHYPRAVADKLEGLNGLDRALDLYLTSVRRDAVKFSLILNRWSYQDALGMWGRTSAAAVTDLVNLINHPSVELSFGDRPTVFVLHDICSDNPLDPLPVTCDPWLFEVLTGLSRTVYGTKPYFVFLGWAHEPTRSSLMQAHLKLEGLSLYSASPADLDLPQDYPVPYSTFADAIRGGLLDRLRNTGSQLIPFASAGWDPSPRFDLGDKCYYHGYDGNHSTVTSGAPWEIGKHFRSVIEWTGYHGVPRAPIKYPTAPAKKILIYAWDEFDEGGWLCPTLAPDLLSPNLERLKALKALLRP